VTAHAGEALSALLDGELSPVEEAEVRAHLADCDACRAELAATERMRSLVRALPSLDLPPIVVERARWVGRARRPSRLAAAAAAVAAVAASVLFVAAGAGRQDPVSPEMGRLVQQHATSGANGDPVSQLTPAAVPVSFDE
jgi:anti-sigma factor RsiW